ncbi:hypothetical protein GE061_003022 [Apolygus lucorum]|uniref:RNase H type-1 domain-containing protein n=1 Tax=Apolygus lucorum TaxID=248454 RepID=A0A8S9X0Z7_APOLU|nr:hypothetical protein GE061_003022 [Apolygus lucorum]
MEALAVIEPLDLRHELNTIRLAEKVARLPVQHWKGYLQPNARLKTQTTFLAATKKICEKYGLHWLISVSERMPVTEISLSVGRAARKEDTTREELRSRSLETLAELYPVDCWVRIYTDGSADQVQRKAGAGYHSSGLFEGGLALSLMSTNFDNEVRAVSKTAAALLSLSRSPTNVVFVVDSQSAILALCSPYVPEERSTLTSKRVLGALILKGWRVVLQWVASHCGVMGNEKADERAKKGKRSEWINGEAYSSSDNPMDGEAGGGERMNGG